jgi:hypothetical protein
MPAWNKIRRTNSRENLDVFESYVNSCDLRNILKLTFNSIRCFNSELKKLLKSNTDIESD